MVIIACVVVKVKGASRENYRHRDRETLFHPLGIFLVTAYSLHWFWGTVDLDLALRVSRLTSSIFVDDSAPRTPRVN